MGHVDVSSLLLEHGAVVNKVDRRDVFGLPLHYAAFGNYKNAAKFFLKKVAIYFGEHLITPIKQFSIKFGFQPAAGQFSC